MLVLLNLTYRLNVLLMKIPVGYLGIQQDHYTVNLQT